MNTISPQSASVPAARSDRSLLAWVLSIMFHAGVITMLGVAVAQTPRGALEEGGRSAGIVLKRTSAEGDLFEGEEGADAGETATETAPPSELDSALPDETAADQRQTDLPQLPPAGSGAAAAGGATSASDLTGAPGRRGSPTGGGSARVSVFGVEGQGTKFVYVFDRSSSMEGAPLAAAKRQLVESLSSLESVHQFHIIFFNHRLQAFDITSGGQRIAFGTDRNKQLAAKFVGGIAADGGTDRYTALKTALAFRPDVVFFLTDADDPMSDSEIQDIERSAERAGSSICVIEFGRQASPPGDNFLKALARQSGGQYGYVHTMKLSR
jgi:hypothetical protein